MLDRRRFVALSSASALAPWLMPCSARAQARAYPTRFVRLIVPFPPGGGTDAIARVVSGRLSAIWGQQMVVENKGGGATSHRHRDGREGRSGRLHRAAAIDAARGEQVPVRDAAVRSGRRSRAGQPDLRLPERHGRADVVAGAFGAGVHRLCQGQSGQGQLRVVRPRHLGASRPASCSTR